MGFISIYLKKGGVTHALHNLSGTNLILKNSLEIRETLYSGEFKPTLNTAKWECIYNAAIFEATREDGWLVEIKEDLTALFTGYLRPANSMTYTHAPDRMPLEAVDTTVLLEGTYEGETIISTARKFPDPEGPWLPGDTLEDGYFLATADGEKSAIHFLIEKSRFLTAHAVNTGDKGYVQNIFRLDRGEDIQKKLADLLWEHGLVYGSAADGTLGLYDWAEPSPVPTFQFDGDSVIKRFQVKRKDRKAKATAVGYQEFKRAQTQGVCLNLAPEYIIADNDSSNRQFCWPPERDEFGVITNKQAWDDDLLQAWQKPDVRNLSGTYAWVNQTIRITFRFTFESVDYYPWYQGWKPPVSYRVTLKVLPDGTIETPAELHPGTGLIPDFINTPELISSLIVSVVKSTEGVKIKVKGPELWDQLRTADNDTLGQLCSRLRIVLEKIEGKGDLIYYHHGEKDADDTTAPRVRTAAIEDRKLLKEYVVKTLTDRSRAEKLAHALDRGLEADVISFDSIVPRIMGEIVQVTYPPKGFSGTGRIVGITKKLSSFWMYSYQVETIRDLDLTEPPYSPEARSKTNRIEPESSPVDAIIRSALDEQGQLVSFVDARKLPSSNEEGADMADSGLYFFKDKLGFYNKPEERWEACINEAGEAIFNRATIRGDVDVRGRFTAENYTSVTGEVIEGDQRSSDYEEGAYGWRLAPDGRASFWAGIITPQIEQRNAGVYFVNNMSRILSEGLFPGRLPPGLSKVTLFEGTLDHLGGSGMFQNKSGSVAYVEKHRHGKLSLGGSGVVESVPGVLNGKRVLEFWVYIQNNQAAGIVFRGNMGEGEFQLFKLKPLDLKYAEPGYVDPGYSDSVQPAPGSNYVLSVFGVPVECQFKEGQWNLVSIKLPHKNFTGTKNDWTVSTTVPADTLARAFFVAGKFVVAGASIWSSQDGNSWTNIFPGKNPKIWTTQVWYNGGIRSVLGVGKILSEDCQTISHTTLLPDDGDIYHGPSYIPAGYTWYNLFCGRGTVLYWTNGSVVVSGDVALQFQAMLTRVWLYPSGVWTTVTWGFSGNNAYLIFPTYDKANNRYTGVSSTLTKEMGFRVNSAYSHFENGEDLTVVVGNGGVIKVLTMTVKTTAPVGVSTNVIDRVSGVTEDLLWVTKAPDKWIVVGKNGTVLTSVDTVTWYLRSTGTATQLNAVACSTDERNLAVGNSIGRLNQFSVSAAVEGGFVALNGDQLRGFTENGQIGEDTESFAVNIELFRNNESGAYFDSFACLDDVEYTLLDHQTTLAADLPYGQTTARGQSVISAEAELILPAKAVRGAIGIADPVSVPYGSEYYNTVTNKKRIYTPTGWVDLH